MVYAPKLSLETASKLISLSIASLLTDCGLSDRLHNIVMVCTSVNILKIIMIDETINKVLL